jgi:hypothetical protein
VSLLQRLAGQARGAAGPRIRSAAAAIPQPSIALPSRGAAGRETAAGIERTALPSLHETWHSAPPGETRSVIGDGGDAAAHLPHRIEAPPPIDRSPSSAPVVIRLDATTPRSEVRLVDRPSASVMPAPLLGEAAPSGPAAALTSAIRPTAPAERLTRAAGEATEVHVHIGRIEVTALETPPAARPSSSARRRRATVPLADYLAKRRSS